MAAAAAPAVHCCPHLVESAPWPPRALATVLCRKAHSHRRRLARRGSPDADRRLSRRQGVCRYRNSWTAPGLLLRLCSRPPCGCTAHLPPAASKALPAVSSQSRQDLIERAPAAAGPSAESGDQAAADGAGLLASPPAAVRGRAICTSPAVHALMPPTTHCLLSARHQ